MKKLTLIISILLLQISCNNDDTKKISYPECLSSQIQAILKSPVQNPKANIQKYAYNGITVYAINYIKNDGSNMEVYNDKCELICSTGSSIDGTPFSSCIDWDKGALIETVWTDPR